MWDQDQYIKGWNFATVAHHQQLLPGSDNPYINHIGLVAMEVMATCSQHSVEQPTLAVLCALLHDTIEDTDVTYDDLVGQFGVDVAQGVMALTKDKTLPTKKHQMLDSLQRIKQQPQEVWMVKLADRITNLQPPPRHWNKQKINNYSTEAQLIVAELGSASEFLAARLNSKIV
jgi:(p)ppGpp synthase/HD superfamily hydrolase